MSLCLLQHKDIGLREHLKKFKVLSPSNQELGPSE